MKRYKEQYEEVWRQISYICHLFILIQGGAEESVVDFYFLLFLIEENEKYCSQPKFGILTPGT